MHTYIRACMHTCMHTYIRACMHTCIGRLGLLQRVAVRLSRDDGHGMHVHVQMDMYMCMCMCKWAWSRDDGVLGYQLIVLEQEHLLCNHPSIHTHVHTHMHMDTRVHASIGGRARLPSDLEQVPCQVHAHAHTRTHAYMHRWACSATVRSRASSMPSRTRVSGRAPKASDGGPVTNHH